MPVIHCNLRAKKIVSSGRVLKLDYIRVSLFRIEFPFVALTHVFRRYTQDYANLSITCDMIDSPLIAISIF